MIVLGLDPSLRNFAIVKGDLNIDTNEFNPTFAELVETSTTKTKRVRKNSDDLERARSISAALRNYTDEATIIFAEIPVGSQSSRAMASYGISIGIISALARPLIQVTPSEVKIAATGDKNATKDEMIQWAYAMYPDLNWLKRGGKLLAKNEHIADSIAAIHAGLESEQFLSARAIFQTL